MPSDIIILKEEHQAKAREIWDIFDSGQANIDGFGSIFTICIGGVPGSGKSEIAYFLEDILSKKYTVKTLSIDEYYKLSPKERMLDRQMTGTAGRHEIDWVKLEIDRDRTFAHYEIVIIEGLYALNLSHFDIGVHIDATLKDTEAFRLERGKENPTDDFRKQIVRWEEEDVMLLKANADYVV